MQHYKIITYPNGCSITIFLNATAALASGRRVILHLVNEGLVVFRKNVANKVWGSLKPDDWSIFPEQYRSYVETFLKNVNGAIGMKCLQS